MLHLSASLVYQNPCTEVSLNATDPVKLEPVTHHQNGTEHPQ